MILNQGPFRATLRAIISDYRQGIKQLTAMKKIFRYLLTGVVVAIVFLVATVALFVALFDANAYKQDLSDYVRKETGRELVFHGDVDLTVYPALGMELGAISLSNPDGFGAQPMVKVKQASVSVDVASLFSLAPEIDKLVMRDLEINLITDKLGRSNWEDLIADSAADSEQPSKAAPADGSDAESAFEIRGAFGGLDLQNIRLLWLDEQAGDRFEIIDLDIATGRVEPNKPFPLTLHLDASASGDLDIVFDLKSNIEYLIEAQQLTLSDLALELNEFAINGRIALSDFAKPTPALRFDLQSQSLDVDALLGTPAAGPAQSADPMQVDEQQDIRIELPLETLRGLDIDGRLGLARIKVQNLHLQDAEIKVQAKDGLVSLEPMTLNLYGGRFEGAVAIDVRTGRPKYTVTKNLQSVQAGDLIRDFTGDESISGSLSASIDVDTTGEWLSELKQNSNGTINLAFRDGALNGFNLRHSIDAAKAKLRGQAPPPKEAKKTDFSSLTLSGVIKNGVFSSRDLDLQAPLLRVDGQGSADLNRELVDYRVNAKLVGTVEGQQGKAADELAGLAIPVSIKGAFTEPEIDVLLDEILKQRADQEKAKVKAEIEAQKNQIKKQLEAEKKALSESNLKKKARDKAKKKLEDKLKKLLD